MKRTSIILAFVMLTPALAHADEPQREPDRPAAERAKGAGAIEPTVGYLTGRWFDVPVTRVAVGLDVFRAPSKDSIVGVNGAFFIAPGSTENGLGAHRVEAGIGVSTRPGLFRLGAGAHLSYAMLERVTMDRDAFSMLTGNIGGFGIGLHACAELAIPLGESVALTIAARGSVDRYDGGSGWEAGPFAGVRF